MPSYNLVDEPWVPCTMAKDGSRKEMGLLEVLVQAPGVREVADPSPLVTVALHRLLLAILHRNFGPKSTTEWKAFWGAGRWDTEVLDAYFQKWRDRFDLFHERYPFYQTASLDFGYEVAISKLTHELASGNNPTLFDHSTDDLSKAVSPAQAARYLLAHQGFAVGGLVSLQKGEDPKLFKSADAAPLVKGAVALIRGQNLFQTLMLNLHCYNPRDEEPFRAASDDCPAWERNNDTKAEDRYPKGYLDWLTWQSRRIRLHPELDTGGLVVVRHAVIMKGNQFPDGFIRHGHETMVAFRKADKAAKGQDPWPAVTFEEEKALWRDSLSLVQSVADKQARPKAVDWLSDLAAEGALTRSQTLQMDLLGLSTDRAKVLFWRHERLPLPLQYLNNAELLDKLREALELAEKAGTALYSGVRRLAEILLAQESDNSGARQADKDAVRQLTDSLAPERAYWPHLETPFKQFLVDLPQDRKEVEKDMVEYGTKTLPQWAEVVRRTAGQAFHEVTRSLDTSARTLKAVSLAQRQFHWRINDILGPYLKSKGGGT